MRRVTGYYGPSSSTRPKLWPTSSSISLVSSARDSGSGRTEAGLLVAHLSFWAEMAVELLGGEGIRIDLTVIGDGPVRDRVDDTVRRRLSGVPLHDPPQRTQGIGYYKSAAFKIMAERGSVELGDGGFTDWTSALAADAKERCLISCVSTERLTQLVDRRDRRGNFGHIPPAELQHLG